MKRKYSGEKLVADAQPRKQTLFGHENPLKMHTLSINFISFTAELYNALYMQRKKTTLASWGTWLFCLSPKSAYGFCTLI